MCSITNLVACHNLLPPEPSEAVTRLERDPGRVSQSKITTDVVTWAKVLGERPVRTERMTEVVSLALKTWCNNLRSTETRRWVPALTPGEVACLPTVALPRPLAPSQVGRRRRRLGRLLPLSKGWGEIFHLSCRPDHKLKPQITTNVGRCINRSPYTIVYPTSPKHHLYPSTLQNYFDLSISQFFQHPADSISERPDGFQVLPLMPYLQMKFVPRFVLLPPVERFKTVFDVSNDRGERWLEVPGRERKSRMGVGCGLTTGMRLYGPL